MQYTIRQVPPRVDESLRERSKSSGRSMNETAIETLARGLGLGDEPPRHHDLDALAGTWTEDAAFDQALAAHDQVDPRPWQ